MRQADVLGQVVVRPEPESRNRIELAVARGQENDGQVARTTAQFAAQLETALDVVLQVHVDHDEIRQSRLEGVHGRLARLVGIHRVALAAKRCRVILTNGSLVLDYGDAFAHLR